MTFLMLAAAMLCAEPDVLKSMSEPLKTEYHEVFEKFIYHFSKSYELKDEKPARFQNFVINVNPHVAPGVPLKDQIIFETIKRGEPVPMTLSHVKHSCNSVHHIIPLYDLSAEEFKKRYFVEMGVTEAHFERSKEAFKRYFKSSADMIERVWKKGGNFYQELFKKKTDGDEQHGRLYEKLFAFPKRQGKKLKSVFNGCVLKRKKTPAERRLESYRRGLSDTWIKINGIAYPDTVTYNFKMTKIRTQDGCNACYAFAATDLLSIVENIQQGSDVLFSVQDIIACAFGKYGLWGCESGNVAGVYDYINANSIALEDEYPFNKYDTRCQYNVRRFKKKIEYLKITTVISDVIAAMQTGPVILPFIVTDEFSNLWWQEIYTYTDCPLVKDFSLHIMVVLGYSITHKRNPNIYGESYFLVKNSWPIEWGKGGYLRMTFDPQKINGNVPCTVPGGWGFQIKTLDGYEQEDWTAANRPEGLRPRNEQTVF